MDAPEPDQTAFAAVTAQTGKIGRVCALIRSIEYDGERRSRANRGVGE